MKQRKIYYSRKNKRIVIEGKRNNKTIYLFTLPPPLKLLTRLNPSTKGSLSGTKTSLFFTKEKYTKLMEKVSRLDYKDDPGSNPG